MLNRRVFFALVIVGVSLTGAAHARNEQPVSSTPVNPVVQIAPAPDSSHLAWGRVLTAYRMLLGIHILQVLPVGPEIEGVHDGPDGVDPVGIRGIKGLIPKYQEDQPPPEPAQ